MTPIEFERAIAKALKSIFEDANFAIQQMRKTSPCWSDQSEDALCFSNACESMIAVLAKVETLRFFTESMIGLENEQ